VVSTKKILWTQTSTALAAAKSASENFRQPWLLTRVQSICEKLEKALELNKLEKLSLPDQAPNKSCTSPYL
jgi:molecular chaperone GrpE (heat shock protein)